MQPDPENRDRVGDGGLGGSFAEVDAVMFDLLTALLDSWTLWANVAGGEDAGRRWRRRYLDLTYATGTYRPYREVIAGAAAAVGLPTGLADDLIARWGELRPWPEAPEVLTKLAGRWPIGVVTNCSVELGHVAAARCGVEFAAIATTQEAGVYKPWPQAYELGLQRLGTPAARTVYVAGSPGDIGGAAAVGMRVVWHNRAGFPAPDTKPVAEITDLSELPALLGIGVT